MCGKCNPPLAAAADYADNAPQMTQIDRPQMTQIDRPQMTQINADEDLDREARQGVDCVWA